MIPYFCYSHQLRIRYQSLTRINQVLLHSVTLNFLSILIQIQSSKKLERSFLRYSMIYLNQEKVYNYSFIYIEKITHNIIFTSRKDSGIQLQENLRNVLSLRSLNTYFIGLLLLHLIFRICYGDYILGGHL